MNNTNLSALELMALVYAINEIGIFNDTITDEVKNIKAMLTNDNIVNSISKAYDTVSKDITVTEDTELETFKALVSLELENTLEGTDIYNNNDVIGDVIYEALNERKLDDILYYCQDPQAVVQKYGCAAIDAQKAAQKAADKQTREEVKKVNAATAKPTKVWANTWNGHTTAKDSKYRLADLDFGVLFEEFYSDGFVKLQNAIDNGIMDTRLTASANAKCNGDTKACAKAIYNSLASFKTHTDKDYEPGCVKQKMRYAFIAIIEPWLKAHKSSGKHTTIKQTTRLEFGSAVLDGSDRKEYDLTDEEVEALRGQYEKIRRTINSMYSALDKSPIVASNTTLQAKILRHKDILLKYKQECAPVTSNKLTKVDPALAEKLSRKTATTLTADEVETIMALLKK